MTVHDLKVYPVPFVATVLGTKRHEIRSADRDFKVGDILVLREWRPVHEGTCEWRSPYDEQQSEDEDFRCTKCLRSKRHPLPGSYTGPYCFRRVTYITNPMEKRGYASGVLDTHVVMSIEPCDPPSDYYESEKRCP